MNINGKNANTSKEKQPTKLANELFDIIHIMYAGLKLNDTHILDDIMKNLRENIDKEPEAHYFASVNTILNKWGTIPEILERLQKNNKPFKIFDFTQSRAYLKEYLKKKNEENKKINF